jgi:hypothetical protein
MHTESGSAADAHDERRAGDQIALSSPSEAVAVYQLAARWAERFGQPDDDLQTVLHRFHQAYRFLDAVTRGLDPPSQ